MTTKDVFRRYREEDVGELSDLLRNTFNTHTAPGWSDAAIARLHEENRVDPLRELLASAVFHEICTINDEINAIIVCKKPHLISVIAVKDAARGQNIGAHLVEHFIDFVDHSFPDNEILQVSATTYSAPFYKRLGFYPISDVMDVDGCRFIRMAYWLRPRRSARKVT